MASHARLSGSAARSEPPLRKYSFYGGAALWGALSIVGFLLRDASRLRLGDLKLLYYLASSNAVDGYLVGGSRGLLFVLHLLVAVIVGGAVTGALWRLCEGFERRLLLAAGVSLILCLVVQGLFWIPVA